MEKVEADYNIGTPVMGCEHGVEHQTELNAIKESQKKEIINLLNHYERKVPHITKYMGSKRNILEFVIGAINDNYDGGKVCDLFAGTSILSGALGKLIPMQSNDIQEYSAILANTYLSNYNWALR